MSRSLEAASGAVGEVFIAQPPARCLFLDRDGVINIRNDGGYVTRWEDFYFREEVLKALHSARTRGLSVVVVSNQRCVARGIASLGDVTGVMSRMSDALAENNVPLAAWFCCPHGDEDNCFCRKPLPGMLFAASERIGIDLSHSYMVGDSENDVEAGRIAGCRLSIKMDENDPTGLTAALLRIFEDIDAQER